MIPYQEKIFKIYVQKIILNIKEMEIIFNEINDEFDKYIKVIPYLTHPIIDNQLKILNGFRLSFEHLLSLNFNEIDINSIHSILGGFSRVYDLSLLNTEKWSERSYVLKDEMGINFKAIIDILNERTNN